MITRITSDFLLKYINAHHSIVLVGALWFIISG